MGEPVILVNDNEPNTTFLVKRGKLPKGVINEMYRHDIEVMFSNGYAYIEDTGTCEECGENHYDVILRWADSEKAQKEGVVSTDDPLWKVKANRTITVEDMYEFAARANQKENEKYAEQIARYEEELAKYSDPCPVCDSKISKQGQRNHAIAHGYATWSEMVRAAAGAKV